MSLQTMEEKILSILSDAEKWNENEIKIKLKDCWPLITDFVASTDDAHIVTQVIRVSVTSFLPHLNLSSDSDTLVNVFLSAILRSVTNLIGEIKAENTVKLEDNLECLLFSVESLKFLLSYFVHEGRGDENISFDHVHKVPNSATKIINLSLTHYVDRNKYYDTKLPELEELLQSVFKEVTDSCSLLCELISKLEWTSCDLDGLGSLPEVCENLSAIAHWFSILSELKTSVIAWKTFVSLIQCHSEELKKDIVLITTVDNLHDEIKEGIFMMKSFEKSSCQKLVPNEERIFDRVLKRCVFNLRILIVISDKFGGFLRGTHQKLLKTILILFRYSSHSLLLENLPKECKKKIDEQLSVGICPLLSNLQKEKEFFEEISSWLKQNSDKSCREPNEDDSNSSSDYVSFLLLLISLVKQELSDPIKESKLKYESVLLRNIIQTLPYCHMELSYPQMLPGVMYDCQAQEMTSLYAYSLTYTCAFMSIFDDAQFSAAEMCLFENVLSTNYWKSLFASDVLCFVARYGSASLCEKHCLILINILQENLCMDERLRSNCLMLLARLLGFTKAVALNNILSRWINGHPPKKLVGELFIHLRVDCNEEMQNLTDGYMFDTKQDFKTSLDSPRDENIKDFVNYMEAANMYCKSTSIQVGRIKAEIISCLESSLSLIFERFPVEFIQSSIVSKMFVLSLTLVSCFINLFSMETIFKLCDVSNQVISNGNTEVVLCVAGFLSTRSFCEASGRMDKIISLVEDIFVRLPTQRSDFVRMRCIQSLVSFAQYSKYEEVFSSVVSQLPNDISDEITQYLQFVPHTMSEPQKLFLQNQSRNILNSKGSSKKEIFVPIKLPVEFGSEEKNVGDNQIDTSDMELGRGHKRKRIDTRGFSADAATEVLDKLECVKNILTANWLKTDRKICIKNKLKEILDLCV